MQRIPVFKLAPMALLVIMILVFAWISVYSSLPNSPGKIDSIISVSLFAHTAISRTIQLVLVSLIAQTEPLQMLHREDVWLIVLITLPRIPRELLEWVFAYIIVPMVPFLLR